MEEISQGWGTGDRSWKDTMSNKVGEEDPWRSKRSVGGEKMSSGNIYGKSAAGSGNSKGKGSESWLTYLIHNKESTVAGDDEQRKELGVKRWARQSASFYTSVHLSLTPFSLAASLFSTSEQSCTLPSCPCLSVGSTANILPFHVAFRLFFLPWFH